MVLQLADALELPLRECNDLLQAAGFAPAYAEPALDDAQLAPVREALTCMLEHHAPFPALVVDRDWQLLQINAGVQRLLGACELTPERLARLGDAQGRLNTLRLTLHPDGLSPFIENRDQVLAHLVSRSRRDQALSLRGHSWRPSPTWCQRDWRPSMPCRPPCCRCCPWCCASVTPGSACSPP